MMRLFLCALALSLLASCGVKGELERPGPIWGDDVAAAERARLEEERAAAERRRREAEAAQATAPAPQ